jgi:hypothetical protein
MGVLGNLRQPVLVNGSPAKAPAGLLQEMGMKTTMKDRVNRVELCELTELHAIADQYGFRPARLDESILSYAKALEKHVEVTPAA